MKEGKPYDPPLPRPTFPPPPWRNQPQGSPLRPADNEMSTMSFRLDWGTRRKMERIIKHIGVSKSDFIRASLERMVFDEITFMRKEMVCMEEEAKEMK